jgi:hypothetical protein
MAEYYVSTAGNDSNPGTLSAPWKTIARVNTAIGAGGVAGLHSRIRFRRGDTFYGGLRPSKTLNPASPGWLQIGAYGDGDHPVISGYKILNTATGWTAHDANTWKLDYSAANSGITYTGNGQVSEYDGVATVGSDVGFLKVDGVIKGFKKSSLAGLANQWDYFSAGTVLYVRSTAKPTTLAGDIRCSIRFDGVSIPSAVEVADLTIEGYGGNGAGTIASTRTRLLRCTIREIGGSYLTGGNTRYGNGMGTWTDVKNLFIESNTFSDVYDVAWSPQGQGNNAFFTDIMFRRNTSYRCSQGEEYSYFSGTGPGFVNVRSEYNTHVFCGYGWGSEVRSEQVNRVGLISYQWGDAGSGYSGDVDIRRNTYYDCQWAYCTHAFPPVGLTSDYNTIALRPGTLIQQARPEKIENPETWIAASGREKNSQFIVLPASTDVDISDADVAAALAAAKTAGVPVIQAVRVVETAP